MSSTLFKLLVVDHGQLPDSYSEVCSKYNEFCWSLIKRIVNHFCHKCPMEC